MPEIADWEPEVALYAENDGIAFYERLCRETKSALRGNGSIAMEMGAGMLATVREIFEAEEWELLKVWPDLSGVDRVVAFTRE
jgi:release factor glutamine methyltransferase